MKNTLSIAMIVKNEAHNLARALMHAHLFADEIIIVDTGSTDNTKEVAKKFTNNIYDFEWCDDFAKARNCSLSKCTQDFIMWLDADDIITKENALRLQKLMKSDIDWDVIYLKYNCDFDAHWNPTFIMKKERIWKNHLGICFQYPIHESLKWPNCPLRFNLQNDEIYLDHRHNENFKNLDLTKDSFSRNIKILKKAVRSKKHVESNRMWACLADEYRNLGKSEEAIECYLIALEKKDETEHHALSRQLFLLATQHFQLKQFDAALDVLGRSIQLYPLWREPFFEAGKTYLEQGRFRECLQMFLICQTISRPLEKSIENENIYDGYIFYDYLALAYDRLEMWEKALENVRKALQFLPNDKRLKKHEAHYLSQIKGEK